MSLNFLDGLTRHAIAGRPLSNPKRGPHATPGFRNMVKLQVRGPDGEIKQETPWCENVMNTFGLNSLASRLATIASNNNTVTTDFVSAMRIGTITTVTQASSTDSSLGASTGFVSISAASLTKTVLASTPGIVQYQATFLSNNPAGAATISEVGIYGNSTADASLVARACLATNSYIQKGASDTINISYNLNLTTA